LFTIGDGDDRPLSCELSFVGGAKLTDLMLRVQGRVLYSEGSAE
jgi:hypothetical protein